MLVGPEPGAPDTGGPDPGPLGGPPGPPPGGPPRSRTIKFHRIF